MEVREVWRQNIAEELKLMLELIRRYRYIAVDTEFPGFLRSTPRNASKEARYRDLKSNVDSMKVIQLGITLFDEPGNMPFPRCCCWQFNFRQGALSCLAGPACHQARRDNRAVLQRVQAVR